MGLDGTETVAADLTWTALKTTSLDGFLDSVSRAALDRVVPGSLPRVDLVLVGEMLGSTRLVDLASMSLCVLATLFSVPGAASIATAPEVTIRPPGAVRDDLARHTPILRLSLDLPTSPG